MTGPDVATVGATVLDGAGRRIGRVDAVFADYLLVRTAAWLPVDLYVPVSACRLAEGLDGGVVVAADDARSAYRQWHRPLKSVAHD